MKKFKIPEILRMNLDNVVLKMKHFGVENVLNFDFIEKPNTDSLIKSL